MVATGLFHSIYGTEGFQGFKLPFTNRKRIRALIGARAERLVRSCRQRKHKDQSECTHDVLSHTFSPHMSYVTTHRCGRSASSTACPSTRWCGSSGRSLRRRFRLSSQLARRRPLLLPSPHTGSMRRWRGRSWAASWCRFRGLMSGRCGQLLRCRCRSFAPVQHSEDCNSCRKSISNLAINPTLIITSALLLLLLLLLMSGSPVVLAP